MEENFNWICPTCGTHTTITNSNVDRGSIRANASATSEKEHIRLSYELIECPNNSCKAQAFEVTAKHGNILTAPSGNRYFHPIKDVGIGKFRFLPTTAAPLSKFVPNKIVNDYSEASLIAELSPKASATLARRALQGMVRDFFKIQDKKTLHHEIEAIKDKCDSELYDAMMAVKSVGNIGAHPEQDVSLMVDVEPGEAETLLNLIHLLDQEWYVARAEREARVAKMLALGNSKKEAQNPAVQPPQD